MVSQIIFTIFLLASFFCFYYFFGFKISKVIGRRVCPVCFSVGSAWLTLLILKYSGLLPINKYLIACLLAESCVGVSYLVEEFLVVYSLKFDDYILKFGIILFGTLSVFVYAFINETAGLVLFAPVIIFGFFSLTPNK